MKKPWPTPAQAMTLIELMVVMAIICIMATFSLPAFNAISKGSNLNMGGQMVIDQFALARQEAVTRNRDVEVRFYDFVPGTDPGWKGIQLWRIEQTATGPVTNVSSKLVTLPQGIEFSVNSALSPLLTSSPSSGSAPVASLGNTPYRAFRFRASGLLESEVGNNNFVTLVYSTDAGANPKNYFTIQLNSLTGKAIVFRP